MTTQLISKNQLDILKKLGLPEVKENNQWLVLHGERRWRKSTSIMEC